MRELWKKLSDTYKILITMLLFIMFIQLSTLLYIWKVQSKLLIEKERKNMLYQLDINSRLLSTHMSSLKKELEFIATLELMDDVLVNDIDKRIMVLLEKKAEDLKEGIILEAYKEKKSVASSQKNYEPKEFLKFKVLLYASFDRSKEIGSLVLLYPFKNLIALSLDNPYQQLWLSPPFKNNLFKRPPLQESIVVSKRLEDTFRGWRLSLAYQKKYALQSIEEVEKILLFAFLLSLLLMLFVIWILSKKQIDILEHTQDVLAMKRTFLSTMSHELRTPLGSILNLTQHLMISPKIGDDEVDMLVRIENSSEHLLEMINNLLQLSKLESNSMQVTKEYVDVVVIIEDMVELVQPLIDEKGLALKRDIRVKNSMINTDVHLFKQVIINLLSNAIKYTEKGEIAVSLIERDEAFEFMVTDTGIGIAKEKQASLFLEFYQAHTKEIQHSSGLGLALSQKVAKLINGRVDIESEGIGFGVKASFSFKPL